MVVFDRLWTKGRCLPWSKEEEGAYIFWMKQVPVLWSGRAVTEHKCVFLFFVVVFVCVCLHVSLYVSNHFNHCIKLSAPCGPLIGNKKILILSYLFRSYWNNNWSINQIQCNLSKRTLPGTSFAFGMDRCSVYTG